MTNSINQKLAHGITRRSFVAGTTIAGINIALFGLTGCAPSASGEKLSDTGAGATSFTAGTYTAESQGKFAPVVVEMSFDEGAITDVSVVEHEETEMISQAARETIPAAILEHQTLNVDTITGCTLTSMAILAACEDCVKQAGGNVSALKSNYDLPEPSTAEETLEADVVVVGSGASGMAAAVASAYFGASKVVLLEKSCNLGGNALVSGGYMGFANAPEDMRAEMTDEYQKTMDTMLEAAPSVMPAEDWAKLKADVDAWKASGSTKAFDSTEYYALMNVVEWGDAWDDSIAYVTRAQESLDWLLECGLEIKPLVNLVGYTWPRWAAPLHGIGGQGYFEMYEETIDTNNYPIEIYLNTPATELITDGNKVTGVVGVADDGTTYRVNAKKGVVLATGSFSGNTEMLREYSDAWDAAGETIPTSNTYGHTGDGITMGLSVGAAIENMDQQKPFAFPYCDAKNLSEETDIGDGIECPLMVNKEGERFMDELADRYTASEMMMQQTDQVMFLIRDADAVAITDGKNPYNRNVETLLEQGQLFQADTIEELGELIGCDPQVFAATVERYNEIARSGSDPDFGRESFTEVSPIENPPFYASPRTWAMHITMGGLVADSNNDHAVLNGSGEPIEGLYAVGEVVNGSSGIGTLSSGYAFAKTMFGGN